MPDHAVFISYARDDLPAVQKLKAGLDAAGVTTWFDLERLEGGDDYDRKIQRNIAPLLVLHSRRLGHRPSAGSKATSAASGATPSTARATSPMARYSSCPCASTTRTAATRRCPDKFKAVHFTRLPGGEVTPEFARRMRISLRP